MRRYKIFYELAAMVCLVLFPAMAFAVTQKEMDQARTIAAKAYLRYANDGSGYLDDIDPKTMEELEAALKPKEKENIKAFKAIPVPSDYKDWNKEKLLEYWAVTAFQDKGLLEKGRGGRLRARTQINKMTIAPPQPEPVATAVPANPAEIADTSANALNNTLATQEEALADDFDENSDFNVDKADNYTWVYIMVLAILVAIVVALVVYAANVLKRNGKAGDAPNSYDRKAEEDLDHYESMITDKDTEIAMLKKKIETLTRQNTELKNRLEAAAAAASMVSTQAVSSPVAAATESPAPRQVSRSIFLGRANMKGIFIRADRSLNPGHSIFVLDTSDGFSGSFRVADSREVWELALSNPQEYLESACTGHNLDDPGDATRILTESSGTAVFEGGCWKVIRKARIRYE